MNRVLTTLLISIVLSPVALSQMGNKLTDQRARESLNQWLKGFKVSGAGIILPIEDGPVKQALPSTLFYVLKYRSNPVAQVLPEPLTYNNLFVVRSDGRVELLSDLSSLEALFRSLLAPIRRTADSGVVLKAWLRLTQEFHQDGFFEFYIPDSAIRLSADRNGINASGKAIVAPDSGKGDITATLVFDSAGKLKRVSESARITAGPRPNQ